jgi:hypothetical protein
VKTAFLVKIELAWMHGSGYFQCMVKPLPAPSALREEALATMQKTLGRAGEVLEHQWVGRESGPPSDPSYHLSLNLRVEKGNPAARGKVWQLRAIIKSVVHPREARQAIWNLKRNPPQDERGVPIYPLLIAPYISDSVAAICQQEGIGWLDLGGNCDLEFGGLWFHVETPKRVHQERRVLKSLFTPKALRVLRVLMLGPLRGYKTEELAEAAGVSLALVSKVRKHLIDQDLGEESKEGIRIKGAAGAQAILRDWLREDDFSQRVQVREYSALTSDFTLVGNLMSFCQSDNFPSHGLPLFTMNFAAWLRAPHNVPTVVSAYLDRFPDEDKLLPFLQARTVSRGAGNLRILVPHDYKAVMIGRQHVKEHPYLSLVSDLQLCLDLHGGEPNGEEQAAVLQERQDFNGGWA